jgi:hypothetical protein
VARLPSLLASSVIRGTHLGESHGGLYRVDLERGVADLVLDWNRTDIDIRGRGGDRGLRGIAFHGARILVAANAELLVLDQRFAVVDSFKNPYLQHCHEIAVVGDLVFLTATGFDSILTFDLNKKSFVSGFHLQAQSDALHLIPFDPTAPNGPPLRHDFHINSVSVAVASSGTASLQAVGMWFSGLYTPGLLYADSRGLRLAAPLPQGTHNAQLLNGGVLYNDTAGERVCYQQSGVVTAFPVPDFDPASILNAQRFTSAVARPRFARGLCALGDGLVAGGSSPSTVSVYDLRSGSSVMQVNLSMDVRNAVHGLAVWPD